MKKLKLYNKKIKLLLLSSYVILTMPVNELFAETILNYSPNLDKNKKTISLFTSSGNISVENNSSSNLNRISLTKNTIVKQSQRNKYVRNYYSDEKNNFVRTYNLKDNNINIKKVKEKMSDLGYSFSSINGTFDKELQENIKIYQNEIGLNETGSIDEITWKNLFITNEEVQKIIEFNQKEYLRFKNEFVKEKDKKDFSEYIVVNIPSYKLNMFDIDDEVIFTSNVIIGKNSQKTPFDTLRITSLKYNPTWTPTPNMLKTSLFKDGGVNKGWIKSHGIEVYNSSGERVGLDNISSENMRSYRYTQPSGDNNALGKLKFETNSSKNIYLHDTNNKKLFKNNKRDFSSGCIRVEGYEDLAKLLKEESKVDKGLSGKKMYFDKVDNEVPVFFTYFLSEENNGNDTFYVDIYKKLK